MRYTPGLWTAERDPCHFDTLSSIRAGDGALCVEVGGNAAPPEQEANARLIASAPDLLAGLREAADAIERGGLDERMCCSGYECGCYGSTHAEFVLHHIRAIIAKATA